MSVFAVPYIGFIFRGKGWRLVALFLILPFFSAFSAPSSILSLSTEPSVSPINNIDAFYPAPPPNSVTVCEGGNAVFQVFTGTAWQWQESIGGGPFTPIPGQVTPKLTLSGVSFAMNGNQYLCLVDGIATFPAILTVNQAPSVTTPNTTTICSGLGTNIALSATAPSTYSWTIGTINGSITGMSSGSGSTINQTLTNPSNTAAGSVEYIITPVSITGSCPGNPYSITVNVNPGPAVTTPIAKTICSGTDANIVLAATVASKFAWTTGTITGGITGASAGSGSTINQILTNPSSTVTGTVQYIVTPTSITGLCAGIPYTITVSVNPSPVVTTTIVATICSGTTTSLGLTASIPSTYSWMTGAITGGISGASAGIGSSISQVLTNPSNIAAGTVDYIVTPTSTAGSCVGAPYTIKVTVNPAPVVLTSNFETICSGTATNIALTANVPCTYTWVIGAITGGITGAVSGSGASINQILNNPLATTPGTVEYLITPVSIAGLCAGSPYSITVTVNPLPAVTTSNLITMCSGTSPGIALTATVGSTYTWTVGTITGGITGAGAGSGPIINQILTNPGNTFAGTVKYIVTPTSTFGSCTGNPYTITVTVNPSPVVTTPNSVTICSGKTPNIGLMASVPSSFTWNIGSVTGGITGAIAGSGSNINQVLTNPSNVAAGTVDYIVTPTSTIGSCMGIPFTITVTVSPAPDVTAMNAATICSGNNTAINLSATLASTYTWTIGTITGGITGASSGSGSTINQALTNTMSPTVGTVQYLVTPTTISGSCVGNAYPITVSVNPTPTVTNSSSAKVCSGIGPNIILTSSAPSSFSWTIGTITGGITGASPGSGPLINQILTNPSNTSSGSVQYIVTPTATSGSCAGIPNSITVTVDPIPILTSLGPVNTCNGTGPNIVLTATGPSTYTWTIGTIVGGITGAVPGSGATINQILNNPSNVSSGTVNYVVTPTSSSNACLGNPTVIPVTVSPTPILTTPNAATICSGFSTGISLTSSDPTSTFTWTIGTVTGGISGASAGSGPTINEVLTNPSNANAGTVQYLITPTSAAGACAIFSIIVTVNPKPVVTNSPSSIICSGSSPTINLTASVASNFSWTIGNITGGITWASAGSGPIINQILINPSGTSSGTVDYVITPISSSGLCAGDPLTITVRVNPAPIVTTLNTSTICSGSNPNILLSASIASTFTWNIGANVGGIAGSGAGSGATINQVLTNPSATNPGSVEYLVTPKSVAGSCIGTPFPITVNINPAPTVTNPSTASTCNGTSPNINLTASIPSNFTWTIGTITGGVTGASPGSGPLIGQILNNPSNVVAGTVQYIVTPTSLAGLCMGNPYPITVTVNPTPTIYNSSTASVCSGSNSSIMLTSSTPSSYTWTVGGIIGGITGASAGSGPSINQVLTNPSGLSEGTVLYIVTPISLSGLCTGVPFAITVTVLPVPILTSSLTTPDICSNSIFSYVPSGSSGATFSWSRAVVAGISNPAASGIGNPSETLINTAVSAVTVTYVYTAMVNGCTNPITYNVMVVVYPSPSLSSSLTPPSICNNMLFTYVPLTSTAGTTFSWNRAAVPGISNAPASGTGNVSEVLINTTPNVLTVNYTFSLTSNGCSNTQVVQVDVNPSPVLNSVLNPPAVCSNTLFSYIPTSLTPGTVFDWSRPFVAGISNAPATGTGNPNEVLINTTVASIPVTYTYTLTAFACINPITYSVTVWVDPAPTLSSTLTPGSICSNSVFVYVPTSSNGTVTGWTRAAVAGINNPASSGSANPNELLINTTPLPVNVTYVYTLTTAGCTNTQNVVVTVNPNPILSGTLTPPDVCSNAVFNYTPASLTPGAVFNWSRVSISGISNLSASGIGDPNETLVNTTSSPIPVTYNYQISSLGCYSSQNLVVNVKPLPVLTSTLLPPAICSNTAFSYSPTSATAGTTFSWSRVAVAGIANPVTSGNGNPNETLLNLTAAPINVTYVFSLSANGCTNPVTYNVVVTVNPAATLTSTLTPPAVCSGLLFNYSATSSTPGAVLLWSRPTLSGIVQPASSGSGNISEFLTSSTALPVNVTYLYTLFFNGCTTTQNVTVTVNPAPALTSSLTPPAICTGSVFHYAATSSTPGVTYSWNRAAVAGIVQPASSGAGDINETLANTSAVPVAVTYMYSLSSNGCTSSSFSVVVVVNPAPPLPVIVPSGPTTFCSGGDVVLTAPAGYNYLWSNGEATQSIRVTTSGSFSVIISDAIGCQSSPSIPLITTALPAPTPPTSAGDIKQCLDMPAQTIVPVAIAPVGCTVNWYDAPAGGILVPAPSLTGLGMVSFYAESYNILTGCTSLIRTQVTLSIIPHPAPPVPDPDVVECQKSPLQTLTATAKVPVGSTIKWYTAPLGGIPVTPTLKAVGTVTYYAEANNGICTSSTRSMVTLTINPVPMAPVSLGNITECEKAPIQTLIALSSDPAAIWYVSASGGAPVSSPTLNQIGTATYYAESLLGSCSSLTRSAPVVLKIEAVPDAPVSGGDIRVCEQSPIQVLTATATAPAGSTVKWYITATGGLPVGSPTLNTVKSITYYAESDNGKCKSLTRTAVTLQIDVAPKAPVPGLDITECAKDTIQTLTATATAAGSSILWYSTPTGGEPVSPILNQVGTVSYFAEANNGSCNSVNRSAAVVLTINPTPAAPLAINKTECPLKPLQVLTAEVETPPAGVTIKWYNSDIGGTSVASPILKTIGSRIYYAEATLDKCINPTRTPVTLTINSMVADPVLKVKGQDSLVSCESNPIAPLDARKLFVVIPGISIVCYDAATGGFEVSPILDFAGSKTMYVAAKNDTTQCVSSNRIPVRLVIHAAPPAPISAGDITECAKNPLQTLDANRSITPTAGTTVVWYTLAKGGTVVTSPTLNKVSSTVTYYAESVDDITKCVSLTRTAVTLTIGSTTASAASNSPLALGQTLQLKGGPELPGNTYLWTDPNGFVFSTMDVIIPSVTVAAAGLYKLTVTSLNGCSATDSVMVVLDIARAEAQLPVCIGATLYLSGFPDNMKSYAWSGPNGYTSSEQNPSISKVTIANSGTYTLIVTNASNATSSDTVSVSFKPLPIPIAEATTICPAGTMQLNALPNGMTSYTWSDQNGAIWSTSQKPPAIPFPNPPQSFKLTIVDWNGCEASKTITPTPFQPKATSNSPVCAGDTLRFRGEPNGMVSYSWTGPNSFASNLQSPSRNNVNPATDTGDYTLTVVDKDGCSYSTKVAVSFNTAVPIPTITPNINPICEGSTLILKGGPNGMSFYDWTGPDGFVSKDQSPQIPNMSIAKAGTYTLNITNSTGCKNVFQTDITVNTVNFNGTYGPYCVADPPVTVSVSPAGGTFTGPGMKGDIFDPKLAGAGTHAIQYTYTLAGGACSIIATKYIEVVTAPKLVIHNPVLKSCSGTTADLTLPEVTAGSTPGLLLTYWQDSTATSVLASPKTVAAGRYFIKGGTPSGKCSDIKPVQVLQPDSLRAAMVISSGLNCSGDSTGSLTVNITMGTAPYTYLWDTQPAQTTDTIKNLPSGTYTVIVTDAKMCTKAFTGKILEPVAIKLGFVTKSIMCRSDINGSARIDTINGSTDLAVLNSYTYLWETTPVQTTREAVRLPAYWQKVSITSPNGCLEKDSVFIDVLDNIPPVLTCPKDVELTVAYLKSDDGSPNKYTAKLGDPVATDNCAIDTITNDAPAKFRKGLTYVIWTVTDQIGLMDTCTQRVFIKEIPTIPQLISPNGDGLNDTFVIDGLTSEDYPDSQMLIYTRSGQLVFRSNNYELPENAWDGKYTESSFSKNNLVATGVYYYILKLGGARSQTLKGYMYVYY